MLKEKWFRLEGCIKMLCVFICVCFYETMKMSIFFCGETGKTVSLDPTTRIVVPEDRFGLLAIDALDPDMVCRAFQVSNFKLHIHKKINCLEKLFLVFFVIYGFDCGDRSRFPYSFSHLPPLLLTEHCSEISYRHLLLPLLLSTPNEAIFLLTQILKSKYSNHMLVLK